MTIQQTEIDAWIEKKFPEFIQILEKFVSIPSVAKPGKDGFPFGKACDEMLLFMQEQMNQIGLETDMVDSQVVIGKLSGTDDCKTIGIACHGDVVPATGIWIDDPFTLKQHGDWLTGRGTTDNKGATLATLFAIRYLKEHHIQLTSNVNLYVGSAEEIGMPDFAHLSTCRKLPDFTLVPDAGFPVCYGEKGRITLSVEKELLDSNLLSFETDNFSNSVASSAVATISLLEDFNKLAETLKQNEQIHAHLMGDSGVLEIHCLGKGKHSASPDGGVDAIGCLARVLDRYCALSGNTKEIMSFIGLVTTDFHGIGMGIPFEDTESGKLTCVLTNIHVSEAKISLSFDIRYPITSDAVLIETRLGKLFTLQGFVVTDMIHTPKAFQELSPMIWKLCDIANKEHGTNDEPYIMGGGTYARLMQPAVAYGLGTPSIGIDPPFPSGNGRAHQPNESVYIPRLKKGISIYIKALKAIDEFFTDQL